MACVAVRVQLAGLAEKVNELPFILAQAHLCRPASNGHSDARETRKYVPILSGTYSRPPLRLLQRIEPFYTLSSDLDILEWLEPDVWI